MFINLLSSKISDRLKNIKLIENLTGVSAILRAKTFVRRPPAAGMPFEKDAKAGGAKPFGDVQGGGVRNDGRYAGIESGE